MQAGKQFVDPMERAYTELRALLDKLPDGPAAAPSADGAADGDEMKVEDA